MDALTACPVSVVSVPATMELIVIRRRNRYSSTSNIRVARSAKDTAEIIGIDRDQPAADSLDLQVPFHTRLL